MCSKNLGAEAARIHAITTPIQTRTLNSTGNMQTFDYKPVRPAAKAIIKRNNFNKGLSQKLLPYVVVLKRTACILPPIYNSSLHSRYFYSKALPYLNLKPHYENPETRENELPASAHIYRLRLYCQNVVVCCWVVTE